ncbi:MAG: thioredoxin [Solirubrobacteraceae bacterium]
MLQTNLEHIETEEAFHETLANNENVMVCCGRMGPMCLPVYDIMETLTPDYPHVTFRDMHFDEPIGRVIRNLPHTAGFAGLPFTVYFKNGEVVEATSSIQTMDQVTSILDTHFSPEA